MNKISCDICMDLIPLIKDGIASEDSCNLVKKHIEECKMCNEFYEDTDRINNENIKMNDKKVISKIKNQLMIGSMIMVMIGSFIGVGVSESEWMFYNIVIMPIVGGLGYFIFNKKSYIVPIGIFSLTYIWDFIKYIVDISSNEMDIMSIIITPLWWGIIYAALSALGIIIGFLLYIAFKKESN
ncbi:zf-HC2 domain-containing protein [Terrisporobacter sp.]